MVPPPTPPCPPSTHPHTRTHLPQIASYLNRLTSDLEAAAYPALDSLTNRVTAGNLERVRRIKSRLVRLTTRVENVSGRHALQCSGAATDGGAALQLMLCPGRLILHAP